MKASDPPITRLLVLAGILFLAACGGEQYPEDLLRADIDAIQQAAENRDVGEFMTYISERYSDDGGRNWKDIRALAQFQFLRHPRVHTFKVIQRLDMFGEQQASISLLAALAGSPIDGPSALSGLRAELMRFDLEFAFDERWKITSAQWTPAEIDSFLGGG